MYDRCETPSFVLWAVFFILQAAMGVKEDMADSKRLTAK
jgi:hypothetical protein